MKLRYTAAPMRLIILAFMCSQYIQVVLDMVYTIEYPFVKNSRVDQGCIGYLNS
jgi:hypothetical protein